MSYRSSKNYGKANLVASNSHCSVNHIRVKAGEKITQHLHSTCYEIVYCLIGEIDVSIKNINVETDHEESNRLKKEEDVVIPPNMPHRVAANSDNDCELLIIHYLPDFSKNDIFYV